MDRNEKEKNNLHNHRLYLFLRFFVLFSRGVQIFLKTPGFLLLNRSLENEINVYSRKLKS